MLSRLSFDEAYQTRVHMAEIALIILAIGLAIGRVTINDPPPTRSNIIVITLV